MNDGMSDVNVTVMLELARTTLASVYVVIRLSVTVVFQRYGDEIETGADVFTN